jgi:hypothetical protein
VKWCVCVVLSAVSAPLWQMRVAAAGPTLVPSSGTQRAAKWCVTLSPLVTGLPEADTPAAPCTHATRQQVVATFTRKRSGWLSATRIND